MKHHDSSNDIGTFELTQPVARISDPCYDKSTWCAGTVDNCRVGKWAAEVLSFDEGSWGTRIGFLIAAHTSINIPSPTNSKWETLPIDVGVDAGQAGIFDDDFFKNDASVEGVARIGGENNHPICEDEPWYSICCDRSLSEVGAGCIPYGCNSSSGYGDGSYKASAIKQNGEVVAIMIDFGLAYEDEDEDEEMETCCKCLQTVEISDFDDNGFCPQCHDEIYEKCSSCDCEFEKEELQDGLCVDCNEEVTESLS